MSGITEDLDGAASILLKAPSLGGDRQRCPSLLTDGVDDPGILFVTFTRGAEACIDQLGEQADDASNLVVITVGDAGGTADREDVETRNVASASDLTGLGIEIGQVITEGEAPVTVCFDSLTSMLQYVEFETAFEFLHTLTGRFYAADARAHYHVDPGAHDEKQLAGIESLFDASVDLAGEEPVVRTRDVIQ
jgi:hypothetical protein